MRWCQYTTKQEANTLAFAACVSLADELGLLTKAGDQIRDQASLGLFHTNSMLEDQGTALTGLRLQLERRGFRVQEVRRYNGITGLRISWGTT